MHLLAFETGTVWFAGREVGGGERERGEGGGERETRETRDERDER
jgi:hypothetical protein